MSQMDYKYRVNFVKGTTEKWDEYVKIFDNSPLYDHYFKDTETLHEWVYGPLENGNVIVAETEKGEPVGENGETISRELSVAQKTAANLLLGGELTTYVVSSAAQKGTRFDSTTTVYSTSTPGGIARRTTVETDANGVVLLSSTTVALDYYVAP